MQQTPVPPPPPPPPQGKYSFIHIRNITPIVVIIPPPPVSLSIPQPTILEEPPIPVGLQVDLQPSQQQQQYPSIALVLPSSKSETNGNQKTTADPKPSEDVSTTLSQQEELSIKGLFTINRRRKKRYSFLENLGREQRHLLMQKLSQHRFNSNICILRNMVGPEEVDDDLEQEITGRIFQFPYYSY